jgi:hypothetical protein
MQPGFQVKLDPGAPARKNTYQAELLTRLSIFGNTLAYTRKRWQSLSQR